MSSLDETVVLFTGIGLNDTKARESAGNKKLAPLLLAAIHAAGYGTKADCPKAAGVLLYAVASRQPKDSPNLQAVEYLARAVADGRLKSVDQVDAGLKFFEDLDGKPVDEAAFNNACGVGVVVPEEEIRSTIQKHLEENREQLERDRYRSLGPMLNRVKQLPALRWANGALVKEILEAQYVEMLGPRDERDQVKKSKKATKGQPAAEKAPEKSTEETELTWESMFFEGEISRLHKPGGNKQIKPELMEKHLRETGGKVLTRFPPEPNGYLHIGHAKAINISFGYAMVHNGVTYLRYDDTNPLAEEKEYFDSILESVLWLGFKPWKITYSSDYFKELYQLAVLLIRNGKAYVDHSTDEELYAQRGGDGRGTRVESPWRNRPIEESLREFQRMREGRYGEGEATLRMKMNLDDGNPQFWDLVAYRVRFAHHVRTGDEWCVYPTYDFTHCLVDSLENITHSLCTTEFRQSRPSYYWLCDAVEVYKPVQWEFGKLSLTNTILSKRNINKMVQLGIVSGWDDPRLFSLNGIRRRGVPPQAVNNFVREVGITTADATIEMARFDHHVRNVLNREAPRLMAVLEPLRVTLTNLPDDYMEMLTLPNIPRDESAGTHQVPFAKQLYIDRSDFREAATADFFRLAPGRTVGLLHVPHPITCTEVVRDPDTQKVVELRCRYEKEATVKCKTYIQWIAESPRHGSPVRLNEVRSYDLLCLHADPKDKTVVPGGWLTDINPQSLEVSTTAMCEIGLWDMVRKWVRRHHAWTDAEKPLADRLRCFEELRTQFVRLGYFCLDNKDTRMDAALLDKLANEADSMVPDPKSYFIVANRTVTLKEDAKKSV